MKSKKKQLRHPYGLEGRQTKEEGGRKIKCRRNRTVNIKTAKRYSNKNPETESWAQIARASIEALGNARLLWKSEECMNRCGRCVSLSLWRGGGWGGAEGGEGGRGRGGVTPCYLVLLMWTRNGEQDDAHNDISKARKMLYLDFLSLVNRMYLCVRWWRGRVPTLCSAA